MTAPTPEWSAAAKVQEMANVCNLNQPHGDLCSEHATTLAEQAFAAGRDHAKRTEYELEDRLHELCDEHHIDRYHANDGTEMSAMLRARLLAAAQAAQPASPGADECSCRAFILRGVEYVQFADETHRRTKCLTALQPPRRTG